MAKKYAFETIDKTTFNALLEQYQDVIPQKLAELEKQRLITVPSKLGERRSGGDPYLDKDEVATLVDWKL